MGPSIFVDGDIPDGTKTQVVRGLQWGRRSSSTETSPQSTTTPRPKSFNGAVDLRRRRHGRLILALHGYPPSMGPSIFVDGDRDRGPAGPGVHGPSMGPSIFVDGDEPVHLAALAGDVVPSMGPSIFVDG